MDNEAYLDKDSDDNMHSLDIEDVNDEFRLRLESIEYSEFRKRTFGTNDALNFLLFMVLYPANAVYR